MKILIVEDEKTINKLVSKRLSEAGYSVVSCWDGEEALNTLKTDTFDGIVMDIMMPKMSGLEVLERMQELDITTPVLLLTAKDSIKDRVTGLDLGAHDYLVKPFNFDRFQMALEKYIAQENALNCIDMLNQKNIDYIMDNSRKKSDNLFPKGIQEKTLQLVMEYLKDNAGTWFTGDEVAEKIGLTGVTVRRYMNYLAESGKVISEMNYETGGRPCMKYKVEI